MTTKQLVLLEKVSDGVVRIVLNDPPLNIVTLELTKQLDQVLTEIEQDQAVRAVIVTGSGNRAFSVGSDVKEFPDFMDTVVEEKLAYENQVYAKLAELSKPTLGVIRGMALGGGCEIALACDMRIMASDARIGLPEIKLGWFPGSGGLYRLPYIVGPALAKELMFFGDFLTAEEALRIGLVNRVAAPDKVMPVAEDLAGIIAKRPQKGIEAIKQGVNKCFNLASLEAIELNLELCRKVFNTEDAAEGIKAFKEKREPQFKHN
ncbi:MAG: enoyl-CoA hydratase/isomerase family protein [Desulfitobacteriaceae bacterium]